MRVLWKVLGKTELKEVDFGAKKFCSASIWDIFQKFMKNDNYEKT